MSDAPGGFLEPTTSTAVRPPVTVNLPERGPFLFPPPYNTMGIRLTNARLDCQGQDGVCPVGYAYWRNINVHEAHDHVDVFVSLDRAKGGPGPMLYSVSKSTWEVTSLGPLFPPDSPFSWASGEGWYWSATHPSILYISNATTLYRYDVDTRQLTPVLDVRELGIPAAAALWQTHTSFDDRVHSLTVRDANYQPLGAAAYLEDTRRVVYHPKRGDFDECQVDPSGQWLLIKEQVDGQYGEDNVSIHLPTGFEILQKDQDGAAGHSDCGYSYTVAEDNWHTLPGAVRLWGYDSPDPSAPGQGRLVYHSTSWDVPAGHLSHQNAQPGAAWPQLVAAAVATRVRAARANEILAFRLDGSLQVLVIAPTMVNLDAPGGGTDDYRKQPKGNLDRSGSLYCWTSNVGGPRLDAFLVRVPQHLLPLPTWT